MGNYVHKLPTEEEKVGTAIGFLRKGPWTWANQMLTRSCGFGQPHVLDSYSYFEVILVVTVKRSLYNAVDA